MFADGFGAFLTEFGPLLLEGVWATLAMTLISSALAYLLGIPLGVLLTITAPGGLKPNRTLSATLGWVVNMGRSLPFVILVVVLIPFTRLVVGTTLGVPGAIVPLVIAAIPFVARIIENSLAEVPAGVIEAAQACGANTFQIITKVLLREGLPSIARSVALTVITLFGYSAIAGMVGAGGLGDIAIRYGYNRYQDDVLLAALVIIIVLIQLIQSACNLLVRHIDKRA
ncbi:MAG: ABC transporter permease [Actinomycetes bacterium]|jgi:D-methionine transport system permease protein|nr:ABC transporter permease [Actinomycetes bacterium]